jgi:hypothetical protein
MARPICLKCGSTKIDDGRSYIIAGLGMCLVVAAFLAVFVTAPAVKDWATYNPAARANIPVAAVMSLGMFMSVNGLARAANLRCRNCGKSWKRATVRIDAD